tara:strand:- start:10860 stop:11165 length:306 start_codon:yes stop_codon:yes gene_type:complete
MRGAISNGSKISIESLEVEDFTILQRMIAMIQKGQKGITLEFHNAADRHEFTGGFIEEGCLPQSSSDAFKLEQDLAAEGHSVSRRDFGTYYITYFIEAKRG